MGSQGDMGSSSEERWASPAGSQGDTDIIGGQVWASP